MFQKYKKQKVDIRGWQKENQFLKRMEDAFNLQET